MQKVYILCGIIGAGKSVWSKVKVENEKDVVVVSKDDIREMLHKQYLYKPELEGLVSEINRGIIEQCINNGKNVVIDECHITKARREDLINFLRSLCKKLEIHIVLFKKMDEDNYYRRCKEPKGNVTDHQWYHVWETMMNTFQEPTAEECDILQIVFEGERRK